MSLMASSSVDFNAHGPVVLSTFMTFRHVARAILPSYEGDPESLPASVEADGVYSYTFPTHFISEDFDETKMRAIALLIDASTGEIVNCLGARFNESQTSSVDAPVPTREVTATLSSIPPLTQPHFNSKPRERNKGFFKSWMPMDASFDLKVWFQPWLEPSGHRCVSLERWRFG